MPDCIEWWGHRRAEPENYGIISTRNAKGSPSSVNAHRHVWIECFGPIADGLSVLHKCDNPPCVNPEHLYLGTHADNMRDVRERGRGRGQYGGRTDTHCQRGHEFTPENIFWEGGKRKCRTCRNWRWRINARRRKERAAAAAMADQALARTAYQQPKERAP